MSETSTLISCTGKITRAELAQLPTPPSTATHVPIPHAEVVEALVDTLSHRRISVVDEEFTVSKDGMFTPTIENRRKSANVNGRHTAPLS